MPNSHRNLRWLIRVNMHTLLKSLKYIKIIYLRSCNFCAVVINQLRWRWRFYKFGWRSHLGKCDTLVNPRYISIGRQVNICKRARLEVVDVEKGNRPVLTIGDGTYIHSYFHCGAAEKVTIGKNVLIAGRVYISDHDHKYDDSELPMGWKGKLITKPVTIEDEVWLGEGCAVLKGVTIGKRAVVGANAVVTKDVPPYTVVAGVPARVIRKIPASEQTKSQARL